MKTGMIEDAASPPHAGIQLLPKDRTILEREVMEFRPFGLNEQGQAISEPAWKTKPSWYLVATDDKMIPAPVQRLMSKRAGSTVVEVAGSHAIYVSQPNAMAAGKVTAATS